MSLGFEMAGLPTTVASEIDDWAGDTFEKNHPHTKLLRGDIRDIKNWDALVPSDIRNRVDGIVGGPPCQGFSLSGNRDRHDPRNSLFMDFLHCVKHFRPKFFVMENVKGLLSMKTADGSSVIEIILNEFSKAEYKTSYSILNSAWFGAPQLRERVFIIGVAEKYPFNESLIFPQQEVQFDDYVTVEMAISDLPPIESGEGSERQEYHSPPRNDYQIWARQNSEGVFNHVAMRHTDRLIERFKVIKAGQSVADVSEEHSALKRGNPKIKSGKVFGQNNMRVFPSLPSPTVAASFQSNFIHPHLNRNFTAREGARLQSFPDNYIFMGRRTTMSWEKSLSQYQQIGNAVPPLLAKAIAINISQYFETINSISEDGGHRRSLQMALLDSPR